MNEDLKGRLQADLKTALRAGEKTRVGALRLLLSELRNREIEKGRALSDDEALALVASGIKSRQESVEQFRKGAREDLVSKETTEIEVLRSYLPRQLTAEELRSLVDEAVAQTGASSPKEIGKVMSWLMPRVRGKAEGAEVNRLVRERLAG